MAGFEPATTRFQGEDSGQTELYPVDEKKPPELSLWRLIYNLYEKITQLHRPRIAAGVADGV